MNGHSRIRLSLSAVAIIGVLMVFGQTSAFAQFAEPQGNGATPAQLGSFLLFGGAYQQVEPLLDFVPVSAVSLINGPVAAHVRMVTLPFPRQECWSM
jgi:hypothetical protein